VVVIRSEYHQGA